MFSWRNMSHCNGKGISDDLHDADHSSDGTILKAMDMETAARSNFPGDAQSVSARLHIQALSRLHTQKVRTLMKSIDELKRKLAIATAQSKDHRRSAMIQAMRTRLKEQGLVVDVVKEEMGRRAGMNAEEVNEWVIRKTIGGPLRFRPKTREELQNELFGLERRHRQALERLKSKRPIYLREKGGNVASESAARQSDGESGASSRVTFLDIPRKGADLSAELVGGAYCRDEGPGGPQMSTIAHLAQLSEALEEVDALRISVRSRDAALKSQGEAIDQLRAETRELKGVQEKLGRKERKAKELKEKNGALAEEHAELMQAYEASREQVRHLNAQLELRAEQAGAEATARAEAFQRESLNQAEQMEALLEREKDLAAKLQAERTSMHRECMELHQCARQALNRADVADKNAREAREQTERLQEQRDGMVDELQRLAREAAEASGLRERSAELAKEVERLSVLAETGQGGLGEARERAARAEEGMRVCQELLKEERKGKERLIAEFSEARARQEVEGSRAKEVPEGRVGLDDALPEHERGEGQPEKSLEDSPRDTDSGELQAESASTPRDKAADEEARDAQPGKREQECREVEGLDQERHPEGAISDAASQSEIGDMEGTQRPVSDLLPGPIADEEDQQLREELASSRTSERTARREMTQLKADLEDARATCERHKAKVMELLRSSKEALSRGDDHGDGDVQGENVNSEPSSS